MSIWFLNSGAGLYLQMEVISRNYWECFHARGHFALHHNCLQASSVFVQIPVCQEKKDEYYYKFRVGQKEPDCF